jgi:outer membrane protein assembly factor BamB
MRRLALIISLGLLIVALGATAASAARPSHILKETFSDTFSVPAGGLCDFNFSQSFTIVDTGVFFDDDSFVLSETAYVTNTNVDTGYTLTEIVHYTLQLDASDARIKQAGLIVHLRDASGKLVVVQAGQLVFDTETGEPLKVTPAVNADFAGLICPALGGQPAIS